MPAINLYHQEAITFLKLIKSFATCLSTGHDLSFNNSFTKFEKCFILDRNTKTEWKCNEKEFSFYISVLVNEKVVDYHPSFDCADQHIYIRLESDSFEELKEFVLKVFSTAKTPVGKISIYNCYRDDWYHSKDISVQSIDEIFIDQGIKESLIKRIDKFILDKERYEKLGRPYKLNLLFWGPPGCGKTSLAKALAKKYGKTMYYMSLSKELSDEKLISLVSDVKDDSVVLYEDIDSFFIDRESKEINVSFSALLNVLDGTCSNLNSVFNIITANHVGRFDPALLRPGRIDFIIKFDYPTKESIKNAFFELVKEPTQELFNDFYKAIKTFKLPMSCIVDHLFRNETDYLQNIDELISQHNLLNEIIDDKTEKMYT